jgi:hypothetical protein
VVISSAVRLRLAVPDAERYLVFMGLVRIINAVKTISRMLYYS